MHKSTIIRENKSMVSTFCSALLSISSLLFACAPQMHKSSDQNKIHLIACALSPHASLNESPLVLVKITNRDSKRIFIDNDEFRISISYVYKDGSTELGEFTGKINRLSSSGATAHNSHVGNNTIGIEPVESLIRLVRMRPLKRAGVVRVHLRVDMVTSHDLSPKDEDWKDLYASTRFEINVIN